MTTKQQSLPPVNAMVHDYDGFNDDVINNGNGTFMALANKYRNTDTHIARPDHPAIAQDTQDTRHAWAIAQDEVIQITQDMQKYIKNMQKCMTTMAAM